MRSCARRAAMLLVALATLSTACDDGGGTTDAVTTGGDTSATTPRDTTTPDTTPADTTIDDTTTVDDTATDDTAADDTATGETAVDDRTVADTTTKDTTTVDDTATDDTAPHGDTAPPCVGADECDDGNACTIDTCEGVYGCRHAARECDDEDACTQDFCDATSGCEAVDIVCDDHDACTVNSCHATRGCEYTGLACDDGNPCTDDSCDTATGCTTTPTACDDNIPCTRDACDPSVGCVAFPESQACDDGNDCTDDLCQRVTGCTNTPVAATCSVSVPPDEPMYVGIWHKDAGTSTVYRDQTWEQVVATWNAENNSGKRLVDIEIRGNVHGKPIYDSVYEVAGGSYALYSTTDEADFDNQLQVWSSRKLIDYETIQLNGQRWQVGVWLGEAVTELHRDMAWQALLDKRSDREGAGLRLVDLEIYEADGKTLYNTVFHKSSGSRYLWVGPTWDGFASKVAEQSHLKLIDVEVYGPDDNPRYAGVWLGSSDQDRVVGGQPLYRFEQRDEAFRAKGLRLVDLERYDGLPVTPVAWAASLYDDVRASTVGYSQALARDGMVIGYGSQGYARGTWETSGAGVLYEPTTRSHLASVSKVITATAFMVARIDLDQAFYPILKADYPSAGAGVDKVLIGDLLTHRSGMDPLGLAGKTCSPLDDKIEDLIAADVLRATGTYSYSNTNYCVARAVLEELTGTDYVTWVNENMFNPMGIGELSAKPDAFQPLLYYSQTGGAVNENAGQLWGDYTSHAGAYGWYGSSVGLVRWLIGLRNNTVLTAAETNQLFGDNLGWLNTSTSLGNADWHNGGWGTGDGRGLRTCVVRFPGGVDGVVLINTTPASGLGPLKKAFEALIAAD